MLSDDPTGTGLGDRRVIAGLIGLTVTCAWSDPPLYVAVTVAVVALATVPA